MTATTEGERDGVLGAGRGGLMPGVGKNSSTVNGGGDRGMRGRAIAPRSASM
jgi:hypothetical protein